MDVTATPVAAAGWTARSGRRSHKRRTVLDHL